MRASQEVFDSNPKAVLDAGACVDEAERQIEEYLARRQEYAALAKNEAELEAVRCEVKFEAIGRRMAEGKESFTAAEKAVGLDPDYREYLEHQRAVVYRKEVAYALAEAAKLRATLATARFKAEAGVQ